jgi:hypothetical protein
MNATPPLPSTRRQFLRRVLSASPLLAAPSLIPASARGADGLVPPSGRINVGLIGKGLMGGGHLGRCAGDPGVQLLAVCDVDRVRRDDGKRRVEQIYAANTASGAYRGCAAYNDYREVLARKDIDAVVIVTPDHWHSLLSIEAARAGKDVYCEKPISLTLREGRELVQTVRRYGRVFQTGTQYRSIPTVREVCEFVRKGGLGKVKAVFTNWQNLASFERFRTCAQALDISAAGSSYAPLPFDLPADPVPEGLDWDLWVGPAAWHPYNRAFHVNPAPGVVPWSFCEDFGAASVTWFHSHSADVIQYALGMEESGPVEIIHPSSGRFPTLTCRYANGTLLHHVDHWGVIKDVYHALPANARLAGMFGGIFVGERGWVTANSTGGPIEAEPASLFDEMKLKTREVVIGANNHHANWFECVRRRTPPSCHEEIGHRSASLGHLVNLAHRLGRSLRWDPVREEFPGDEPANRLRARASRQPWSL